MTTKSARDLGPTHRSWTPTCVQPASNPAFRIGQPRPDRCRLDTLTEESTLVRSLMMSRAKEIKKAFRLIIRHRGCCTYFEGLGMRARDQRGAPPSLPTPGSSSASPMMAPAPAPGKLSLVDLFFVFSGYVWSMVVVVMVENHGGKSGRGQCTGNSVKWRRDEPTVLGYGTKRRVLTFTHQIKDCRLERML